jgi:DNA-binding beta-propeller fold protein YncE
LLDSIFWPLGVAADSHGNVFVTDAGEGRILKIEPSGIISVFAGNGTVGNVDGPGHLASFNRPSGLAIDHENHLFVADSLNQEIRMISPEGEVTTVTRIPSRIPAPFVPEPEALIGPVSIAIDHDGHIFVTDVSENQVRMVSICAEGEFFDETTQQCDFFLDEWLLDDEENHDE